MTTIFKPLLAVPASLGLMTGQMAGEAALAQEADVTAETLVGSADKGAAQQSFAPDFFAQYAPRTALDMVSRIPGFSIRSGDLGKRGLGQGGANILINGERLTGKSDPFGELDQILASNVTAIRILDGASLSIPGLSGQVADVRVEASAFSGSWEWNPEFRKGLQPNWTNGRVNISGETGDLSWSAFARDFSFRGGANGLELRRDAQGEVFERRIENIDNYGDRPGLGVNLTWKPREDHTANLNGEYALFNFRRKAESDREALREPGETVFALVDSAEDETYWELGADYELPLLGGTFKAVGYLEREASPTQNTFSVFDPRLGFTGASRFAQEADEAESILRGEYSWAPSEGRSWQIGIEGAFNSLEVEQTLSSREPGGEFVAEPLDGFEVSEDRYEATLTHSRPLGPKWDVQASIGAEYSELSQVSGGVAGEPREFIRPKGFIAATYKRSDTFNIRTKIEREVGQLNFFDFVASVDLQDDLGRVANPDLVPSQSWFGSVEFDKDFGGGNTLKFEVYGSLFEDIVDRIPVGDDGDAVGNLDSAMRYGFDLSGTLRGDRWGLDGVELEGELNWRDSSVDDPLLGFDRRLNGDLKTYYEVSLRHDIPNTDWAWGGFIERFVGARSFRTFTIGRFGNTKPFTGIFVEHKDIAGIKAQVRLLNLLDASEFSERDVFDARRDRGALLRSDDADYSFGQILQFRLSGEF